MLDFVRNSPRLLRLGELLIESSIMPLLYLISKLTHIIAAQQVLKWYMKALPVIHLGTTSAGTSSSQIATTLAALTGEDYSVANIKTSNQTEADLYNNIANSLRLGCAVVVNVKTVPGRYTSSSGHFMVVHGSFIDMAYPDSSVYFTYTDPHYNDNYYGTFTLSGASMYDAIDSNAGNYVRVA